MRALGARLFRIGWFITPLGAVITIAGLGWVVLTQSGGPSDPIVLDLAERIWTLGLWMGVGGFLLALSGSALADSPRNETAGQPESKGPAGHSGTLP